MAYGAYGAHFHRPDIPARKRTLDPDDKTHAQECRAFLDSQYRYNTTKRSELERAWNRARMYDAGRQWLQPFRATGTSRLWYAWEPLRISGRGDLFPRPVRNVFAQAMQDEISRLVGVGRDPYVRVDDQELEEAGLVGKRVLTSRLEDERWKKMQRLGGYHMTMFGLWIQTSTAEVDLLETMRAPVKGAVKCAGECPEQVYSSTSVPPRVAMGMANAVREIVSEHGVQRYDLQACPGCGGPLEPFEVGVDAMSQQDRIGRPLAREIPKITDTLRVQSPYSFFPQNQGVGYEADDEMEEYGFREPVSMHWLKRRYRNAHLVRPSRDFEVFRHHPVLAGYWGLSYGSEGTWDNHTMLDRWYLKPTKEFPEGRAIHMAGDVLLLDAGYYIDGTDVPWCDVKVAQWELREGEIWGKSLAEDMFSIQDNVNSALSQIMDIRQKYTNPKMVLAEGMSMDFAGGSNEAYQSDIWKLKLKGVDPSIQTRFPMFFGNQAAPQQVWQEINQDLEFAKSISGARDTETGNVHGVELNYSALLFAATKSAERRKPRVEGMRELIRGIFTDKLHKIAKLWVDERIVRYKDDENQWQVQKLTGAELRAQWDVQLEDDPVVDTSTARRASIQQAMDYGTIRPTRDGGSFATDRRINRAIGLPPELNEDRNNQYDHALKEWDDFIHAGIEPAIDPEGESLHHPLHFAVHSDSLMGREARALKSQILDAGIPWPRVLRLCIEWKRLMADLQQTEAILRAAPSPEKLAELGAPPEQIQKAEQGMEMLSRRLKGFPKPLELQIDHVWRRLLESQLREKKDEPARAMLVDPRSPLTKLVRFNAHRLATWMLGQGTDQAAMVMVAQPPPAPGAPAPGGPAPTMTGPTGPTPGMMAEPQPSVPTGAPGQAGA